VLKNIEQFKKEAGIWTCDTSAASEICLGSK